MFYFGYSIVSNTVYCCSKMRATNIVFLYICVVTKYTYMCPSNLVENVLLNKLLFLWPLLHHHATHQVP